MLSTNEIRARAYQFATEWNDETSEDAEGKSFWDGFFNVFGMPRRRVASFEKPVKKLDEKQGYIDLLWKGTLLVEHKSRGKNLDTAYKQALGYFPGLKDYELPKYVLVSDFARFKLYDLEAGTEVEFLLADLSDNIDHFGFISGYQKRSQGDSAPVNQEAAELMAKLHDAIVADGFSGHALEVFLMRVLFCLFAEDTGIFEKDQFREFLERRTHDDGSDTGIRLGQLFKALNTPQDKRQKNLDETLAAFEYINGRMFEEVLDPPEFNSKQREQLIRCTYFDWSQISPAIFGSLFQSVTDPKRRRTLGAHYTSETNILKVVSGLFLDELQADLEKARISKTKLEALHNRLAKIKFLDPSCGCGNFLVITYRELRRLEMNVFEAKLKLKGQYEFGSRIDVHCAYGIEIEEFPARVAETAMWLMDHLMNREISSKFGNLYVRIPLKASAKIVHANALRIDWNDVLPAEECSYVLGNPPFVGKSLQTEVQTQDLEFICRGEIHKAGLLDYVAAWYIQGERFMRLNPRIKTAFVSTNSLVQGEQVAVLWGYMLRQKIEILFAHRTFSWMNEASDNAAVHCAIVGFGLSNGVHPTSKYIYYYDNIFNEPIKLLAKIINPYLMDAANIVVYPKSKPLSDVPSMTYGSKPTDGGYLLLTQQEKEFILINEPELAGVIRPILSAHEYLNGLNRYCFWLENTSPSLISNSKELKKRLNEVRNYRAKSTKAQTRLAANTPQLFAEVRQPKSDFILIPQHTSENRKYVPFGYFSKDIVVSNSCTYLPNASLYHFGIISSATHMAWMRTLCGRIKSDYRYSNTLVYNNFPWPEGATEKQKIQVEAAVQAVLDARAAHPGATLAQLYDPLTMPPNLVQAHRKLDALVDKLYGLPTNATESQRIAKLFELYQQLTAPLLPVEKAKKKRAK